MKIQNCWGVAFLAVAAPVLLAGCGDKNPFVKEEPEPTPTPAPTPKPGLFDPTLYNTPGVPLNKAGDDKLPDHFEIVQVYSGNLVALRSVDFPKPKEPPKGAAAATPAATPAPSYGVPVVMRLAGISVPDPRNIVVEKRLGAEDCMRTLASWLRDPKTGRPRVLNVEQDSKYPVDFERDDLDAIRVKRAPRVQVFFDGGKDGKTRINLNRMMIRSGYAVVNQYEPTIFDVTGWLNDEEYARQSRLGLWKLNIVLKSRQDPPAPGQKAFPTPTPAAAAPAGAPAGDPGAPGAATPPTPPATP